MKNDDANLIQRILNGDEDAFSALVQKYQKPVHALAWRIIGDFHIAEEITQDVFLIVYKQLATLKNSNSFSGWVYVVTTRHCIAWLKKKRIPMKSLDTMPPEELEELAYVQYHSEQQQEIASERQREVVKRLLQKLPESERTVVTLHYLGEMACEDISKFLGVSPNTVKSRLHRARNRLKKEEHMIRETLGNFQLSTNFTDNIIRKMADIKPAKPTGGKSRVPWGVAASTAALVIFLIGSGTQSLVRYQQPFNLDAASETTIEIVEPPFIQASKQKLSLRNQFGNTNIPTKNDGNGDPGTDSFQTAAEKPEQSDTSLIKSRWIPTGGPEGTSGGRVGLFATAEKVLYAVAARGIYRLTEDANAWKLICESTPTRQFQMPMAEQGDTLYVVTPDELLSSTDRGITWDTVGPRPKGRAFELLITDEAFYLIFEKDMFRSDDNGRNWVSIMLGLHTTVARKDDASNISISDCVVLDNTVIVGTNQGLYRFTSGTWEKIPVPLHRLGDSPGSWYITSWDKCINSLIVTENLLYVIAGIDPTVLSGHFEGSRELGSSTQVEMGLPRIFRSDDFGVSWVNISPSEDKSWIRLPATDDNSPLRLFSGLQLVAFGETLVVMGDKLLMHSDDGGDTWTNQDPGDYYSMSQSIFPTVALDEYNFYTSDVTGIARSTDAGASWSPFIKGMGDSHVLSLIALEETLYALIPGEIVKSTDQGESWTPIDAKKGRSNLDRGGTDKRPPTLFSLSQQVQIAKSGSLLYASLDITRNVQLFHLSAGSDRLVFLKTLPGGEVTVPAEWHKRFEEAKKKNADLRELLREINADISDSVSLEEELTSGGFTVNNETVFIEFGRKLYRWRQGEAELFNTGIVDTTERAPGADTSIGFKLAASGDIVYAGKRDGSLLQSLDNGESWQDITDNLPLTFAYFKEIVFAGPTVYIVTDQGAMNSHDGINWNVLTDTESNRILITRIAVDDDKVYSVSNQGVYRIDSEANTWIQISPEVPYKITALAVDGKMVYIGTRHRGVLRLQLDKL